MKGYRYLITIFLLCLASPFFWKPGPSSTHSPPKDGRVIWDLQRQWVEQEKSTSIVLPDLPISRDLLPQLKSVATRITELNLVGDDLAEEIDSIAACSHLKVLHLRTKLGDKHLAALAQLRELEVLDLPLANGVTDAGLKALNGHPRLKLIRIRAPRLTNAGVAEFQKLPELRWLHLMEVPLTDDVLLVFRHMPKLESLYLDGDQATDEGLSALILARPDLHFHRDQVHLSTDPRSRDGHPD